jgi:class I fructose-bisphosphate aldolase/fructose-bisphosphate aldolase/2-amino-3,7-dideoxy-D-threo-hept-6-ulosonate synthase
MPLLAEPIPVSFQETKAHTIANVASAARIVAEAGADFAKVHYVAPASDYRQVTAACFVPVLILGGPAKNDPREALQMAADALSAGARGVVFGRNIVTHPRPDRMAAALGEIVHGGATAEAAARSLATPH